LESSEPEFWRLFAPFAQVSKKEFLDATWQAKHTVTKVSRLIELIAGLVPSAFIEDIQQGFSQAPMALRISPYVLSLIDWSRPSEDPLRKQFIPIASDKKQDHPELRFDSLAEQRDAPVPGLTHRYPDKALFLALDTCPVYCRFCTRSYAVGPDSEQLEKVSLKVSNERWSKIFEYIRSKPALEDIVISGGDVYNLRADQITLLGESLLAIPNVRRMRFATKGPAIVPQKIVSDDAWFGALARVVSQGRRINKDVVLHTHFNHPNEITWVTKQAMARLFQEGITVRNQTVLQRAVNDDHVTMTKLVRALSSMHVHPYYVYMHDMVKGVEDLRTTIQQAIDLEKHVRGATAGFNTPTFVVDAPGGGGKRDVHAFEHYNRTTGISVYKAPAVKPGQAFLYFDPIHLLGEEGQARWADPVEHRIMIDEALAATE